MERLTTVPNSRTGWIGFRMEDHEPTYWVRCRDDGRGGIEVASLVVSGPGRITAATLRSVPIGRIEATINGVPLLLAIAREAADKPDSVLEELTSATVELEPVFEEAVAEPLKRPDRTDPETFYAAVADRYRNLVRGSAKPAVLMAEEADVPVATARRWINEARRRGLLPPGRQGRAK
jgi:hypothetical protein